MTLYSQRDPQWKDRIMGDSPIGNYGCLITCLAMISDIQPDVMDNLIDGVAGYSGNYLIWEKLDLIKSFDFIKRVKIYNNDEVSANLPCLVEVNGAPIGGITHWVLYIGNQKCWDPWDGKEKPTSTYQAIGYAVVKYTKPTEVPQSTITDQTKIPQIDNKEVQQIKSEILAKDSEITNLKLTVASLNAKISELEEKLNNLPPSDSEASKTLQDIHDILYGSGWWWIKWARIKVLIPK